MMQLSSQVVTKMLLASYTALRVRVPMRQKIRSWLEIIGNLELTDMSVLIESYWISNNYTPNQIRTISLRSSPCKSCRISRNRSNSRASYSTSLSSSDTFPGTRSLNWASIDANFTKFRVVITPALSLRKTIQSNNIFLLGKPYK